MNIKVKIKVKILVIILLQILAFQVISYSQENPDIEIFELSKPMGERVAITPPPVFAAGAWEIQDFEPNCIQLTEERQNLMSTTFIFSAVATGTQQLEFRFNYQDDSINSQARTVIYSIEITEQEAESNLDEDTPEQSSDGTIANNIESQDNQAIEEHSEEVSVQDMNTDIAENENPDEFNIISALDRDAFPMDEDQSLRSLNPPDNEVSESISSPALDNPISDELDNYRRVAYLYNNGDFNQLIEETGNFRDDIIDSAFAEDIITYEVQSYIQTGRITEAISQIDSYLGNSANSLHRTNFLKLLKGLSLMAGNNLEEASAVLNEVVFYCVNNQSPGNADLCSSSYFHLAKVLLNSPNADYSRITNLLERVITDFPNSEYIPDALFILGKIYYQIDSVEDYQKSYLYLNRLVNNYPRYSNYEQALQIRNYLSRNFINFR